MVKKQNKKANKKEDILLNIFHEEQDKKGYISIDFLKKQSF